MSGGTPSGNGPAMPWSDRGDGGRHTPAESPRSRRDLEILRALARRINPQDASAHNNLGVVYYNKGLYAEAVRHFERALDLDPRMQVAERNLQICYYGTGHLAEQTAALRQRLDTDPDDTDAHDQLARLYFNSGDVPAAVRELRALLEARPDDAAVHLRLARAELKRGDLDAALISLRRAEALDSGNARVHFMIGEVLYQRGKSDEAREALERAVALDDRLADAFHLLAFVYGDLNDAARAQRSAARAAQLNPSYGKAEAGLSLDSYSTARYQELIGSSGAEQPAIQEGGELAHYNLGLAFRQRALYDEALREFRLATERGEDSFLVQQAQAEMLLMRGDSAEALQLYQSLIEHERGSPKLWNELGVARHQTGALHEAEQAYRKSLEIDPDYSLAWNNLAIVRHHRNGTDAEEALRAALREGRALTDVWRNLALLLQQSGRGEEALEAYERALELDPSSAHACTGMGILLLELGRAQEARGILFRAVELDPQLAEARYHLGFAYSALGDYQSALRETKVALELNPYIPTPRFRLLIDLQFEEASLPAPDLDATTTLGGEQKVDSFHFEATSLERVFDETPDPRRAEQTSPGAELLNAARQSLERGMLEQASSQAQRASMYGADRMEVLLLQGEIFLRRDLSGEAVERFSEALAEIRRSDAGDHDESLRRALHGAARSLLDLGRMNEAIEAAERLCELAPGDVEALRTLGEALSRVRDYARAAIVLEQARLAAPDDVNLLTRLGEAYAAADDIEAAEAALRRAISLDSWAVGARTILAGVLAGSGRGAEAGEEYAAALRTLPTYGAAAFGLAALHERNGRLREAIGCMVDLLTHDPARFDALNRLGELLVASGRENEARFAFERVLRFDPDNIVALEALERLAMVQV